MSRATVVICTRDRASSLRTALRSVLAAAGDVEFDVLVVDNASTDETADVVRTEAALTSVPVRYALEPQLGLSHARNHAIRVAGGEVLLFTDDDVSVEPGWVDALVSVFDDPSVIGAGGRILPRWPYEPPAWLDGPHAIHLTLPDHGDAARDYAERETPIGANMAVRATAARAASPAFDPSLGNRGGLRIGFEEWLFFERIRSGGRLAYVPSARVWHCIDPSRMTWTSMRRAWFQGGFGLALSELSTGTSLPVLPRRVVRAARSFRYARRTSRLNSARATWTAEEAHEEFSAYSWAGRQIGVVVGRSPRLTGWLAGRLA